MTALSDCFPKEPHPGTGEPFIREGATISERSNAQLVDYFDGPPDKPGEGYFDDDDCWIEWTPTEQTQQLEQYEAAHAAWVKRGSPHGNFQRMVQGAPPDITGTFTTASGATASGVRDQDGVWHWAKWSPS